MLLYIIRPADKYARPIGSETCGDDADIYLLADPGFKVLCIGAFVKFKTIDSFGKQVGAVRIGERACYSEVFVIVCTACAERIKF